MKYCAIQIQNSENKIIILRMLNPETRSEIEDTIKKIIPRNFDGTINLPLAHEVSVQPYMFQYADRKSFDWVSVNWSNKIVKIDKKTNPNHKIDLHPYVNCIITLRPGFCDKNNIQPGDTIIL